MSVTISINNAIKRYGNNTIIPNLSLNIKDGEFFTLLGPSGCGKTTLLRMIAGFNSIEGGEFYFNEAIINDMPAEKRNIGMVFQNYAIFPHMSVRDNVAFGLKNRKLSKDIIQERVQEMLEIMQIEGFADRMPEKLSGGQQQRVALARAVVIKPDVLLMDEPLSNLDAKLRVDMRTAIKDIQQEVNITTVYVTHDQEEAMSVSDRIAVMNLGEIQHIGTPQNIYQRPNNLFVATFIGRSNILEGTLDINNKQINFNGYSITYPTDLLNSQAKTGDVKISIRPEEFTVHDEGLIEGIVRTSVFLGLNTHYTIELDDNTKIDVVTESELNHVYNVGDTINLDIKKDKINIFSEDGKINYVSGVQNDHVEK